MDHLEKTNGLDRKQYGFREAHTTMDAIDKVITQIKQNKTEKRHQLVLTLDLKNAFNSAWTPAIIDMLRQKRTPEYLVKLCPDFLTDRKIQTEDIMTNTQRGCPQGSSLGPALWLVLMEDWFDAMDGTEGLTTDLDMVQAFADDQIIILTATSLQKIENKWSAVWKSCENWARKNKLTYNKNKTSVMFIPNNTNTRTPRLKLEGQNIDIGNNLEYLGMTIDSGLLWLDQVKKLRKKTTDIANKLYAIAGRQWGKKAETLKLIYERAIKPMALYGAEIWGQRIHDTRIMKQLNATERPFLRAITKAYNTAPTAAIQVIAGCIPLAVEAEEMYRHFNVTKDRR